MEHTKYCAPRAAGGEARKGPPAQMDKHHTELRLNTWQPPQVCLSGSRSISRALLLQAVVLRGNQQWVLSMGLSLENSQEQLSIIACSCCKAACASGGCFPWKTPPKQCRSVGNCLIGAAAAASGVTMLRTVLLSSNHLCCQPKSFRLDTYVTAGAKIHHLFWPCFPTHLLPKALPCILCFHT